MEFLWIMLDPKHSETTQIVIGAAMKVHNTLGSGFQEVIYQRAFAIELNKAGLKFEREVNMPIYYDNRHIGTRRVDFLIEGEISVEIKAVANLENLHIAQAKNYLEAYDLQVGLLINFGSVSLQFKRVRNLKARSVNPNNP